jgi:hypothetical protein
MGVSSAMCRRKTAELGEGEVSIWCFGEKEGAYRGLRAPARGFSAILKRAGGWLAGISHAGLEQSCRIFKPFSSRAGKFALGP